MTTRSSPVWTAPTPTRPSPATTTFSRGTRPPIDAVQPYCYDTFHATRRHLFYAEVRGSQSVMTSCRGLRPRIHAAQPVLLRHLTCNQAPCITLFYAEIWALNFLVPHKLWLHHVEVWGRLLTLSIPLRNLSCSQAPSSLFTLSSPLRHLSCNQAPSMKVFYAEYGVSTFHRLTKYDDLQQLRFEATYWRCPAPIDTRRLPCNQALCMTVSRSFSSQLSSPSLITTTSGRGWRSSTDSSQPILFWHVACNQAPSLFYNQKFLATWGYTCTVQSVLLRHFPISLQLRLLQVEVRGRLLNLLSLLWHLPCNHAACMTLFWAEVWSQDCPVPHKLWRPHAKVFRLIASGL